MPLYWSLAEKSGINLNAQSMFNRFAKLGPVELKCKIELWGDLNYLQKVLKPSADCGLWRGTKDVGDKMSEHSKTFPLLILDYNVTPQFSCVFYYTCMKDK